MFESADPSPLPEGRHPQIQHQEYTSNTIGRPNIEPLAIHLEKGCQAVKLH